MSSISIHQPQYLPWHNYFKKMKKADIFIILDTVDFQKNGLQNRNQIKTSNGVNWLTVPVLKKKGQKIYETKIDNKNDWIKKHWKALEQSYNKSPFFNEFKNIFREVYSKKWNNLSDLNITLIKIIREILNIKNEIYLSSNLKIKGNSSQLLLNLCKHFKVNSYLMGEGSLNYLDQNMFHKNNINLLLEKNYILKNYKQNFMQKGFIPNLSVIDVIFNCGSNFENTIGYEA